MMQRLRQRADFLSAATGLKLPTPAFVLQSRERGDDGPVRVGFTVSRKVGNAVQRNRARRRLREVVRLADPAWMSAGHDYVLVGRQGALKLPFDRIQDDFKGALRRAKRVQGLARRPAVNRPPDVTKVTRRGNDETTTQ